VYKLKRLLVFLKTSFQLDVRALSLMRIGVALVVLADLFIRAQDLSAFFTNDGFWSTKMLYNFGWQPGYWSLHTLNGSYGYMVLLFCIHAVFALQLLLGYKTRLATLLVWIFTISLHNRNLFILQSGDDLLRLVLFWGLFLPWGNAYSIDSKKMATRKNYFTVATMGYLLLIASVYFFTVCFKNSTEWRTDGTAIYFALSLDQIRLPMGDWLYEYPMLMKGLTYFVFVLELLIPLLILIPFKRSWARLSAFVLLIILHIGIGFTLYVGLFYVINMVTAIGLIPSSFFDQFERFRISNVNKIKRKSVYAFQYVSATLSFGVIAICLILNLSFMNWFSYELNSSFNTVVNVLRLNQYWGMFSPHIMKEDGWYVYNGYTEEGKHWDLFYNTPYIITDKPKHLVKNYKSDRWRKLGENIQRKEYTFLRPMFCKYYLKKWNREHPENKMKSLDFIFFQETSDVNYTVKPLERTQFCFCISDDQ
jgi:uncharacterized membrane protein YphA (DoxX/SURF4 family)